MFFRLCFDSTFLLWTCLLLRYGGSQVTDDQLYNEELALGMDTSLLFVLVTEYLNECGLFIYSRAWWAKGVTLSVTELTRQRP